MVRVRVRYLVLKGNAAYWQPTKRMREAGYKPVKLTGTMGEIAAKAEELTARWDLYRGVGIPALLPGTLGYLREKYTGRTTEGRPSKPPSFEFAKLRKRSQKDYNYWLDAIEADFGDLPVTVLTPKAIKTYYHNTVKGRGLYAGFHMMGAFRAFLSWCVSEDEIEDNPAIKVVVTTPTARSVRWQPEQVQAFIAKAHECKRPSMALAVLLADWTAQRPSDIRNLLWSNYDGENLVGLRQQKTKTLMPPIPLSAEVRAALDAAPRPSDYVLISEGTQRIYTEVNFERVFADIRKKAGLPSTLKFHDFRRTAATEIADAGAGDDQLRSITGHKDRNVVLRYAQPSAHTAAAAMDKRLLHRAKAGKNPAADKQTKLEAVGK